MAGGFRAAGHKFGSRTDTEVILHLYEDWSHVAEDITGMFAFAIRDRRIRLVVGARPDGRKAAALRSYLFWIFVRLRDEGSARQRED